ncbi:MAG: response regulator transcription factor [Elusimicrobia bacterium]|nr:response regulator transcription factor [Elusimicrobiota bacterium]
MQYKILVVDDETCVLESLKLVLQEGNISVITAMDGETCLKKAEVSKPDLIILDINLPDMDGFKVCRILKKTKHLSHIPIIILTGVGTSSRSIVAGLEAGACDYILKPFDHEVLMARVKVALRWLEYKGEVKELIKKCGVEINLDERKLKVKGKPIDLTRKEFDIISILVKESGKIVKHKDILETVWGSEDEIVEHTLESHVSNLKRKLGSHFAKRILTVKGVGYKLKV